MDEQSLIQDVQTGRTASYAGLIDLHLDHLRRVIALQTSLEHLIDEVAHEAFVFAFLNIHRFRRGSSFFAWLSVIARNILRAEVQRSRRDQANRKRYGEVQFRSDLPRPSSAAQDAVEASLRKLPPAMRELIDMRYRRSLSTREIAMQCNRSLGWVRITLHRLRARLRLRLEVRLPGSSLEDPC